MRPLASVTCALISAALIAAATRPWGLGPIAAVGYVPAFLAMVSQRSGARGAWLAAIASLGSASVGYEAANGIAAWAYPVAVLLATLPFAAAGAVAGRLAARIGPRLALAALPPLWCAAEFVPAQSALFGVWALPLSAVGYSQADLPSIQLARFSSVSAVSLALLAHNALIAGCLPARWLGVPASTLAPTTRRRRVPAHPLLGIVIIHTLVLAAWGTATVPVAPAYFTVRGVQPHLPQAAYVAAEALPASRSRLLDHLLSLTNAHGQSPADLVVWPETSWPGSIGPDAPFSSDLPRVLAGIGPLLFGALTSGPQPTNSAFVWNGADLARVYDKERLVPVAEDWFAQGRARPLPHVVAGAAFAPMICYDAVFPGVARAAARGGAALLVVITNDAFAGPSDVPAQHARAARFRAVETGLPLVLVSNMGPSAAFGPDGAYLGGLPLGATAAWQVSLPLDAAGRGQATPYVRFGDSLGAASSLVSLAAGAFAFTRGGAPSSRPRPT